MGREINSKNGLTTKQKEVIDKYFENGYKWYDAYTSVYSTKNRGNASKVWQSQSVQSEVNKRLKEDFATHQITAERVLKKLEEIAFADKTDKCYQSGAQLKALDLLQKQLGLQKQQLQITDTSISVNVDGEPDATN